MVDLAWKSLVHDRTRFVITVGDIAFAVLLVLVQVGPFLGLLSNVTVTIENADADLWITAKDVQTLDFAHAFSAAHVNRVRSAPGIQRADNLIVFYYPIALPTGREETIIVYGMERFGPWRLPWEVLEGNIEDLLRGPYILVDESAEWRLGAFRVGDYREIAGRRMKIVGRTRGAQSFTTNPICFMSLSLAQELAGAMLEDRTVYSLAKLAPNADLESTRCELARRLTNGEIWTKAEWAARSRDYWIVNTGLGVNMYLAAFLGCLVGLLVVAQAMYAYTNHHLRELGMLKAIGGSNLHVYRIIARQAAISGFAGFVLALGPAALMHQSVAGLGLKMIWPYELLAGVLVGAVGLSLLASMLSFRAVGALDPAVLFR